MLQIHNLLNFKDAMIGALIAAIIFFGAFFGLNVHSGTKVMENPITAPAAVIFDATKFCMDNKVGPPTMAPGAGVPLYIAYGPDSQELHYTATPDQTQALWFHKVLNPTTNVREQASEPVDVSNTTRDCFISKAGR